MGASTPEQDGCWSGPFALLRRTFTHRWGSHFLSWEGRRADAERTELVLHNTRTTPAPNRQGWRGGRVSWCLLRPPGSFYTFREVGLILSSSPADCSCCCCCSDPADHVARCDLDAAKAGAGGYECPPCMEGTVGTEVPLAPAAGCVAILLTLGPFLHRTQSPFNFLNVKRSLLL